jgi:hypothetical protein
MFVIFWRDFNLRNLIDHNLFDLKVEFTIDVFHSSLSGSFWFNQIINVLTELFDQVPSINRNEN